MKIGFISDLHTDISMANRQAVAYLIKEIAQLHLDVFIIGGDISPNLIELSRTLLAFNEADPVCAKLFVPGNHDIWVIGMPAEVTSEKKCAAISAICAECGFYDISVSPLVVNNLAFCGTIGWYDYSFRRLKYKIPKLQYATKRLGNTLWNDGRYAKWGSSDLEMARHFEDKLQTQVDSIRPLVSKIVVVTHHVPFRDGVYYQGKLPADFFCAFMGSRNLGKIALSEPLVKYALFGHSHRPFRKKIGHLEAICSPIGYLSKPPEDLKEYVKNRLTIFEV